MAYQVDMGLWGTIFPVPTAIVDQHIRMCSGASLKVLLILLRHSGESMEVDTIADLLRLPADDVRDAVNFWIASGILKASETGALQPGQQMAGVAGQPREVSDSSAAADAAGGAEQPPAVEQACPPLSPPEKSADPVKRKTRERSPQEKLSMSEIQELAQRDDSVQFLLHEAETRLCKTLSSSDTATLVWLYDYAGIPVDVLLMVIAYCKSLGKNSLRYIQKVALEWFDQGVDTVERAENRIQHLNSLRQFENTVRTVFGIRDRTFTTKEQEYIRSWEEFAPSAELLRLAYDKTVENTGRISFAYVHSILSAWHTKGISTVEAAAEDRAPSKGASGQQSLSGQAGSSYDRPSYDLEEFKRMTAYSVPKPD